IALVVSNPDSSMRLSAFPFHELEQLERSGSSYGLGTALYAEFATEVQNVLLDRVDTEDEVIGDLAVGRAIDQQAQHLALTLREELEQQTGAMGSPSHLLARSFQQGHHIPWCDLVCIGLMQQDQHRCPFIEEEADIALWLGQY